MSKLDSPLLRDARKLYVMYLAVGVGSLPAGVAYSWMHIAGFERWWTLVPLLTIGICTGFLFWKFVEGQLSVPKRVPLTSQLIPAPWEPIPESALLEQSAPLRQVYGNSHHALYSERIRAIQDQWPRCDSKDVWIQLGTRWPGHISVQIHDTRFRTYIVPPDYPLTPIHRVLVRRRGLGRAWRDFPERVLQTAATKTGIELLSQRGSISRVQPIKTPTLPDDKEEDLLSIQQRMPTSFAMAGR